MMAAATVKVDASREGAIFRVKAQPGAPRTAVKGEHDGALKIAVAAPPEKGKANEALVRFLAGALEVDRRAVEVISGETARVKAILVRGADPAAVRAKLEAMLET